MNYLGHLFLSGDDPLVIVGNFMGDAIKGRDLSRFPPRLETGIRLHRAIDSFTDTHPAQQAGRERVRSYAGRYSGVVMDLFFDHLLASDWQRWHPEPLADFAQRMYALVQGHADLLPERTSHMLRYMVARDWLGSYATIEGLGRALHGLSTRVPQGAVMTGAEQVLADHLEDYRREFDIFLPAIRDHTASSP